MKCLKFSSESEAEAENQRIMDDLGIPDGKGTTTYSVPFEQDGHWYIRVKNYGPWAIPATGQEAEVVKE